MPEWLYVIIGASVALLTILVSIALLYLIFMLRDVNKVVDEVEQTVEKVQDYIMKPIHLTNQAIKLIAPFLEGASKKVKKK